MPSPDDKLLYPDINKTPSYKIGEKCPNCDEIYTAWHWMVHDPEGAEEEMFGDDWP